MPRRPVPSLDERGDRRVHLHEVEAELTDRDARRRGHARDVFQAGVVLRTGDAAASGDSNASRPTRGPTLGPARRPPELPHRHAHRRDAGDAVAAGPPWFRADRPRSPEPGRPVPGFDERPVAGRTSFPGTEPALLLRDRPPRTSRSRHTRLTRAHCPRPVKAVAASGATRQRRPTRPRTGRWTPYRLSMKPTERHVVARSHTIARGLLSITRDVVGTAGSTPGR